MSDRKKLLNNWTLANLNSMTEKPFALSLSKRDFRRSSFDRLRTNGEICQSPVNKLHGSARFRLAVGFLLVGLSMSGALSAQQSAGHTVTIRIIRPILFSIAPVENRFQADLRQKNNELQLNWKSDSKPKKITVSRNSDDPGSKLDLILSGSGSGSKGNQQKSRSCLRLEAVEENLTGAISGTAGSLTMRYDSGSNSRGVSESANELIYYTVMDI